jgi:hypothetical protein
MNANQIETKENKMKNFSQYQWVAVVMDANGYRYCVSHKGIESESEIIKTAESFYGKKINRIVEWR